MSILDGDRKKPVSKSVPRLTLAQEMAEVLDIPENVSRKYLLRLAYVIAAHLKAGEAVVFSPLGTFRSRTRESYTVRAPKGDTNEKIRVPERLIMSFRQSNKLKSFLADRMATPEMAPERLRHKSSGKRHSVGKPVGGSPDEE